MQSVWCIRFLLVISLWLQYHLHVSVVYLIQIFFFLLITFKIWISNGGLAEVLTVFARTDYTDDKVRGLCMLI